MTDSILLQSFVLRYSSEPEEIKKISCLIKSNKSTYSVQMDLINHQCNCSCLGYLSRCEKDKAYECKHIKWLKNNINEYVK